MKLTKGQIQSWADFQDKSIPKPWPLREIVLTGFLVAVLAVLLTLFVTVNP